MGLCLYMLEFKYSYLLRELEFWNLPGARGARYRSRLRIGPTVTLLPDSRAKGIRKQNTGICPHPRLHVDGSAFQPGNAAIRPSTWPDIPILQLKTKTRMVKTGFRGLCRALMVSFAMHLVNAICHGFKLQLV